MKTRIAPSPTGPLHIGTARTALFNYLFAKKNGGEFLLRFEDTDSKRSTKESENDILDGLKWLGLDWDGEIQYQSKRLDIYQKKAEELIEKGFAYEKDGAVFFSVIPTDPAFGGGAEESLSKVRDSSAIARDDTGKIEFIDLIRGKISFDIKDLKDFVIVRSDGTPLFALTNVIDDFEIDKITHILRAEDHITNTASQILLALALGYNLNNLEYGHFPLIVNADHSKMSKRKDPVSISVDFQKKGYLPEAMVNYMALLGWNPGEGSQEEFFSLEKLAEMFSLDHVGKSPSVFEIERLNYFNRYYISKLPLAKFQIQNPKSKKKIEDMGLAEEKLIIVTKERVTTLNDIDKLISEIIELPDYDKELLIFKKSNLENSKRGLLLVLDLLDPLDLSSWEVEKLKTVLEKVVAENNLQNGDVFWSTRVALSGREKSNPPQELLWALEKEESLARIKKAVEKIDNY